jgi:hypothetical protein
MIDCPYDDCPYQAKTQRELDDHVLYMIGFDDPDHAPDKLKETH